MLIEAIRKRLDDYDQIKNIIMKIKILVTLKWMLL